MQPRHSRTFLSRSCTLSTIAALLFLPVACGPHDPGDSTETNDVDGGSAQARVVTPPAPVVWGDAPVRLSASLDHRTGEQRTGEQTIADAVTFTIPDALYVRTGNAGMGQALFQFRTTAGITTCTYQGASPVAHPTTDLDRMHGRRFLLVGCDDGHQRGQSERSTWFALRVVGGDAQDPTGVTSVSLHLGGGCSDPLPAPLAADEVVAMREGFSWESAAKLPETNSEGHPAWFHGLIYIDAKAQLAALDRLRVLWSAQPLSERYMASLRGKCGRVEHATDGRGVVVYAVFPARLFNVLRDFGIQASKGGVAPPFKLIIPSSPGEPEHVNPDGSLKYAALVSSGFGAWLAARPAQQPSWYDPTDWPGDISDAAHDAYDWAKDNVYGRAKEYGEYGFDYVVKGFDAAIDWSTNALDDVWEQTQQVLGNLVGWIGDKVTFRLKVAMLNRDAHFPARTPLTRVWGSPAPDGSRPPIVPTGAHVRVRQWGWGFLPIMDQNQLGESGEVTLRPVKGAKGRGGDLCIEMDTDYAMITTDFVPNEVCDFAEGRYGSFEHDVDWRTDGKGTLEISQPDLYGLAQIKDASDYYRIVEGASPYTFDVLTGWVANQVTGLFTGNDHRAMCLCLDFPGTGASVITSALGGAGAAGFAAGTTVGGITTGLAIVGASLIEKDLWWPDADEAATARDARGVITHEYGHFTMCSHLFAEDGPPALTGLIARVFEGKDDSRGDEAALMTETWADAFATQVVGGANYVQAIGAVFGRMNFCTASPCMDFNYRGANDYSPSSEFRDEMARFESLVHDAFDRADGANRFAYAPANGDVWRRIKDAAGNDTNLLEIAPAPYLVNADEPVSLPGSAWRTWVRRWLQRGRTPSKANVIGGLAQTMADYGYNWCDRCDVLALHDKATDPSALGGPGGDPTGGQQPTASERYLRWLSCTTSPEIENWLGAPPAPALNMDATCTPCPRHHFVDSAGTCQACPAGSIAAGNHCIACPLGGAASSGEECIVI